MWKLLLFVSVLVLPVSASADPYTKAELFDLYVEYVSPDVVSQRLDQLFTNLEPGAFKTSAKATLKQDLNDAIQAQIDAAQAILDTAQAGVDAQETEMTDTVITPLTDEQTNVGDTDL